MLVLTPHQCQYQKSPAHTQRHNLTPTCIIKPEMHFNFINIKKRQIRNCHLAKFAVLLVSNFQMLYFCISINVKWCHLVSYWLIDVDDRILVLDSTDTRVCQCAKSPKVIGFCEFSHSFGPKDFTK